MWHKKTYDEHYLQSGEKHISDDVTFDYIFRFLSIDELLNMRKICHKFNSKIVNSRYFKELIEKKIQRLKKFLAQNRPENTYLLPQHNKYNNLSIKKSFNELKTLLNTLIKEWEMKNYRYESEISNLCKNLQINYDYNLLEILKNIEKNISLLRDKLFWRNNIPDEMLKETEIVWKCFSCNKLLFVFGLLFFLLCCGSTTGIIILVCIYHSAVIYFNSNKVAANVFYALLSIAMVTFACGCVFFLNSYCNPDYRHYIRLEREEKLRQTYRLLMKVSPSKKARDFRKKLKQEILADIMKLFKNRDQVAQKPIFW
jgi:hypothetical protein